MHQLVLAAGAFFAAALLSLAQPSLAAQGPGNYPDRPMRIITGYLPGGVSDTIARVMAEKLGEQMGQRIIIDGRPGAGGTLAMTLAAQANPDGYTIFMGQPVITISPNFRNKPPYDPIKAFAPVSVIGLGATMMVVHPQTPASSVKELIAYGKSSSAGAALRAFRRRLDQPSRRRAVRRHVRPEAHAGPVQGRRGEHHCRGAG